MLVRDGCTPKLNNTGLQRAKGRWDTPKQLGSARKELHPPPPGISRVRRPHSLGTQGSAGNSCDFLFTYYIYLNAASFRLPWFPHYIKKNKNKSKTQEGSGCWPCSPHPGAGFPGTPFSHKAGCSRRPGAAPSFLG